MVVETLAPVAERPLFEKNETEKKTYTYEEAAEASLEYFNGNDLPAKVFLSKYALRDKDNNLLEKTPSDMHRRIAKEFSRIEKKKFNNPLSEEEIFGYLDNFKYIIPQGSPMYGIGNKEQYVTQSNCFVAGTRILTKEGVKNIEDVKVGDEVVTHRGTFEKVSQLHKNELNGRRLFDLKCFRTPNVTVTDNHKFLSISQEQEEWGESPQWNSVEYLRKGDYIAIPDHEDDLDNASPCIDLNELFTDDIYTRGEIEYIVEKDDKSEYVQFSTQYKTRNSTKLATRSHQSIKSTWEVDEHFAYFVGLWYGDGCVFDNYASRGLRNRKQTKSPRVRGITFTFCADEKELIEYVSTYGEKIFGIKADVNNNRHIDGTVQIVYHSTLVGIVFEKLFGRKAVGKRLNNDMFSWNKNLVMALTQGLIDSDGTVTKEGDLRVVMSNHVLVEQFYHLLRSFNIPVGICKSVNVELAKNYYARLDFPKYSDFISSSLKHYDDSRIKTFSDKEEIEWHVKDINGKKFVRIDSKTQNISSPKYVYTIGVENNHSYPVEGLVSLNCYVIESPKDSYGDIMRADEQLVQISKRRGGVGLDISNIRPNGAATTNSSKKSTGIIPFMSRYSSSIREVGQHNRRGALIMTIDIHHPECVIPWDNDVDGEPYDVQVSNDNQSFTCSSVNYNPNKVDFATAKFDASKVTGANISIRLSDEFMSAVKKGTKYEQRWPVDARQNGEEPVISKMVDARAVWNKIIFSAWRTAEPGLMFWDNITRNTPSDAYAEFGFASISSNPCSEICMNKDACRLMVLNLFSFVNQPFTKEASFDYKEFHAKAKIAQRLLDDLVDLDIEAMERILAKIERDPESDEIKQREKELWQGFMETCKRGRRTGLGPTAVGDMLAALGIQYGSNESIKIVEDVYKVMKFGSYEASVEMAEELGPFDIWDWDIEKDHPFISQFKDEEIDFPELKISGKSLYNKMEKFGRRSIANLTTAPTGTVSILAKILDHYGTSSGIEPQFSVEPYTRKKKISEFEEAVNVDEVDQNGDKWQHFTVYSSSVKAWMDVTGKDDISKSPWKNSCAEEINWKKRVELQAAAQKHVCHAISSTLNLPSDVPQEKVAEIYMTAYESGCKGITVYRDGCRTGVLVKPTDSTSNKISKTQAAKRPDILPCEIFLTRVKGYEYFVIVGFLDGEPYEVFAGIDGEMGIKRGDRNGVLRKIKRGYYQLEAEDQIFGNISQYISEEQEGITRLLSCSLRHGADINFAVHQLEKTKGDMGSFCKALARVLKKFIVDGTNISGEACPSCNSELHRAEGCKTCKSCGWTACS